MNKLYILAILSFLILTCYISINLVYSDMSVKDYCDIEGKTNRANVSIFSH